MHVAEILHLQGLAAARRVEAGRRPGDGVAQRGLHLRRVFLGDHAAVELEHDLAGNDVGVGAAADEADVEVRVADAFDV